MGLATRADGADRFAAYVEGLTSVIGHADRAVPLRDYCAAIWSSPVDAIDTKAVLGVITPHWQRVPETASRLRGRIEAVLDYAKAHGWRSGENPAAWRNHLVV